MNRFVQRQKILIFVVIGASMFAALILDFLIPQGVAIGTLYIFPVFLTLSLGEPRLVLTVMGSCLGLAWLGFLASTPADYDLAFWTSVSNRLLSSGAVLLAGTTIYERLQTEKGLYERIRKQQAVSLFGRRAVSTERIDDLMQETCRVLAEFFGAHFCKILRFEAEQHRVVLSAGFGWKEEDMGWSESTDDSTFAAFTMRYNQDQPLIVDDLTRDKRFKPPALLVARGIRSCVNVLIPGKKGPYGILEVDAVKPSFFKQEDAFVLQQMSNILGDAIERCRAEEELKRSNRGLEEFTSIASHDLQEPLRKIFNFSDRVFMHLTTDEGRHYLEKTKTAAHRMKTLLDNLLLFSRVQSEVAAGRQPVDLNGLLRDVLEDLELRIQEKKAEVRVEPLPTVAGNYFQIHQLFTNLLSNSLKYTSETVRPSVRVAARPSGAFAEIRVEDNGIGFDEHRSGEIFRPFTRLHGRDRYDGTGMGLAICKRVVEQHGGHIWATSRPGEGSVFRMTLPLVPPA